MYRIRLHGRGGQGIKTAAQILGTALFRAGYEVQDAPRYGAERRGAPIVAYVRAAKATIHERGVITRPDIVVVADDSLLTIPAAGVLQGLTARCVLFIASAEAAQVWRERLRLDCTVLGLPFRDAEARRDLGAICAGAAARLLGVIPRACLLQAIDEELGRIAGADVARTMDDALGAYDALADRAGLVVEGSVIAATGYTAPLWVDLTVEPLPFAASDIGRPATSVEVATGVWRTQRPVIDYARCNRCSWVCSTLCPDSAIAVEADGTPRIDYAHCKGCMICVTVCPPHAIHAEAERGAGAAS